MEILFGKRVTLFFSPHLVVWRIPATTLLPPPLFTTTASILRPATTTSLSPSSSISGELRFTVFHMVYSVLLSLARMAQPSSSHRGERQHRSDRERDRSHRHHRTISSTTLLLVLSLVLAVLAVMLSLPSGSASSGEGSSMLSYLSPKRTQALIARESAVAVSEAEVARREAEILVGAPGGVIPAQPSPISCPTYQPSTVTETLSAPTQT